MGKRKLATPRVVKAVVAASQEAINTRIEAADDTMRVQTPGGVFSVRWDERGRATALGQLAFFAEYRILGAYPASPLRGKLVDAE